MAKPVRRKVPIEEIRRLREGRKTAMQNTIMELSARTDLTTSERRLLTQLKIQLRKMH